MKPELMQSRQLGIHPSSAPFFVWKMAKSIIASYKLKSSSKSVSSTKHAAAHGKIRFYESHLTSLTLWMHEMCKTCAGIKYIYITTALKYNSEVLVLSILWYFTILLHYISEGHILFYSTICI